MEKTYKRVPFDIELAKKIQAGEIKGRIVTSENLLVRIVDFNLKDKTDSIVYIGTYANGEQEFIQTCDNEGKSFGAYVLYIELPEEAPKQLNGLAGCDGQCHSCTNDCTQRKYDVWTHNFKVGDKVTISGSEIIWTIKEIKNDKALIFADEPCGCAEVELRKLKHYKEKYEFKPFDKVLVLNRDNKEDKWSCDIFSHKEGNGYVLLSGYYENFDIIPYEGNEHLVGTTNNPE